MVKGISLWSAAWRVKGWRSKGKPVPNADLWSLAVSLAQARPHLAVMHVFSHVGVPGNEGADTLASSSLDRHPLLAHKAAQPAQALTPTQPSYDMPRMVHMHFAPPIPLLEAVQAPRHVEPQGPQPKPLMQTAAPQPIPLSAAALGDLQRELLQAHPQQQGLGRESVGSSEDSDGPRIERGSTIRQRDQTATEGRGEGSERGSPGRGSSSRQVGSRIEEGRIEESVWGALGLEQMSSRGSVTVGSSIDSGDMAKEPGPLQDAVLAGESSTDSGGCSGPEESQTVYSTDVSGGVRRRGRARYGRCE